MKYIRNLLLRRLQPEARRSTSDDCRGPIALRGRPKDRSARYRQLDYSGARRGATEVLQRTKPN